MREKIGDVFTIIRNGVSIKQGDNDTGSPITRIETISDWYIDRNKFGYAGITDLSRYEDYLLNNGDILMSHINSEKHLGKVALYKQLNDEKIIHGMNLLMLRADKAKLLPAYANFYFRSDAFRTQIPRITKKSVNQASFTVTALKELSILVPTLREQESVAFILQRINDLIALRKQQLAKLDELVKSRFIEMFGDPITNSTNWPTKKIYEVCRDIYGGGTPSKNHPEYFEGDIPWVSPKDMRSLTIADSLDHITNKAVKESTTNMVPPYSVLMVIRSGILKHSLPVAINIVPVAINQDMKAFIPSTIVTPQFLLYYFKAVETDILSEVRAVTADNIDFTHFKNRTIIVPSRSTQNEFANFVSHIDKSKFVIQKSLERLEILQKSLMQEYFG